MTDTTLDAALALGMRNPDLQELLGETVFDGTVFDGTVRRPVAFVDMGVRLQDAFELARKSADPEATLEILGMALRAVTGNDITETAEIVAAKMGKRKP